MTKSVAIVASTLPFVLLKRQAGALGIESVIATSDRLARSFGYLNEPGAASRLSISSAPASFVAQAIYFGLLVAKVKISGRRLVIFHECCLPVLDLVILLLRPRGDHFPQVSMLGNIPIEASAVPRSKLLTLFRALGLTRFFQFYYSPPVGANPPEYVMSIKSYPAPIRSHPAGYKGEEPGKEGVSSAGRAVLLLVGKAFAPDEEQIDIFRKIAGIARQAGFECHIKDHPNPAFRLGLTVDGAKVIDPEMPSELLAEDYAIVVGTRSTGMLKYGARAFSIVEMLESLSADEVELAKRHFDETAPGHELGYLTSLDQLNSILERVPE